MKSKLLSFFLVFILVFSNVFAPGKAHAETLTDYSISLGFVPKHSVMDYSKPIVYSIDAAGKKVYSINYLTKEIKSIQLDLVPERLYCANNKLYVALLKSGHAYDADAVEQGAIAIVNLDSFVLEDKFDVDVDPYDLVVDKDGIIYVASGSGQWTDMKSYSSITKAKLGNAFTYMKNFIALHPTMNKIYAINTVSSPVDIYAFPISNGSFPGPNYDSPYHGDFNMTYSFRISPDGKYIFNGAGTIFNCADNQKDDIKYRGSLKSSFLDIAFDLSNNVFYTGTDTGTINSYKYDTLEQNGIYSLQGKVENLFNQSDKLIAITNSNGAYNINVVYKSNINSFPMVGSISVDNAKNVGNYTITINIPANSKATSYKLYNGTAVESSGAVTSENLVKNISVTKKSPGIYTYKLETINDYGSTFSKEIVITVDNPVPFSTTQLGFQPKQVIMNPVKPIVYAIDANNTVYSINLETKETASVKLDLVPERLYYANNKLYVALLKSGHTYYSESPEQGAIAIINLDDFTLKSQFDIDIDPYDIVVDKNDNIYITGGSNQWSGLKSFSGLDGSKIASTSRYDLDAQCYAVLHPTMSKIYTITTDVSPRDIKTFNVSNGTFPGPDYDSPYHGDYAMSTKMRISPDGKYIFNGAGTIFTCSSDQGNDMKYVGALDSQFTDIAFDIANNRFYISIPGGKIKAYDYTTLKPISAYTAIGEVSNVFDKDNYIIAVSKSSSNNYYIEGISKTAGNNLPLQGELSVDNANNYGSYNITINIPMDNNATSYKLYNGATIEDSGTVTKLGLTKTIAVNGKAVGTYAYKLETINDYGATESNIITVTVSASPIDNNNAIIGVSYQTHVENIGWQAWTQDGTMAGTQGKALRVEGIKIKLLNAPAGMKIKYQAHVENIGWQDYTENGLLAGTEGKSLRVEALRIKLENADGYSVQYQTHVENIGWQDWAKDGEVSGTEGKALRIEGIRIKVVKVDNSKPSVMYQGHVEDIGWQDWQNDGALSGTQGKALRVEGLKIKLINSPENMKIRYQAHVENIGWQDFTGNGEMIGTQGKALRIEAIRIILENAPGYSVQYQVHVENVGWQDWVQDGVIAGTTGRALRIEAIRIRIVKSGNSAWNISNLGKVAQQGDWIYYSDVSNNGALTKIKVDGTQKTILNSDNVNFINVVDDWIYYCNFSDVGNVYRVRIDGTAEQRLNNKTCVFLRVIGDKIYYADANQGYDLYEMDLDGLNDINSPIPTYDSIFLSSEDMYINNENDNYALYKYVFSKNAGFKITDDSPEFFSVSDGWIYYNNTNDNGKLYKIRVDGTEKTKLSDLQTTFISIFGDWIYFNSISGDGIEKTNRIKKDGSGFSLFGNI